MLDSHLHVNAKFDLHLNAELSNFPNAYFGESVSRDEGIDIYDLLAMVVHTWLNLSSFLMNYIENEETSYF